MQKIKKKTQYAEKNFFGTDQKNFTIIHLYDIFNKAKIL